jgi:transcriptional regulator with XRE-family HTH domain
LGPFEPLSGQRRVLLEENAVKVRRRLRLSQSELADVLRVTKTTVANWENGRAKPTPPLRGVLLRMASLLERGKLGELLGVVEQSLYGRKVKDDAVALDTFFFRLYRIK